MYKRMCIVSICASVHNKSVVCRVCVCACPCMYGACAVSCLCHGACVFSFCFLVFFPRYLACKGRVEHYGVKQASRPPRKGQDVKCQVDAAAPCTVELVCGVPYKPTSGLLSEFCSSLLRKLCVGVGVGVERQIAE